MSTSYGSAIVKFPGLKPIGTGTTDGALNLAHGKCSRTIKFSDGTRRKLSKKERSLLLTHSRKWRTGRRNERGWPIYRYRTLDVQSYY